ncbi:hypothetical protein F5Y08DRAFT_332071 [Xylaria arbuscula]|nr:hypothetical protein F5Y08DRAFT_332071 [Xylaria arbuscula]
MIVHHEPASPQGEVSLLILGAGWTSTFLLPLLQREGISHAATTTTGRDGTIPFLFDPESSDTTPFTALPSAKTILITFPLKGPGPSSRLVSSYAATHAAAAASVRYIQFGVTSIWNAEDWQDTDSPYDTSNPRAVAEDELMRVAPDGNASVLSLAGLYGAARQPRNWVHRVITSKEALRAKGALHVIHGEDVARAVVALHRNFTPRKRWLLCDMHVYDWWDLTEDWARQTMALAAAGGEGQNEGEGESVSEEEVEKQGKLLKWVGELMWEENVRALPRNMELLGRRLDGRGFWQHIGIWPSQGRIR